MSISRRSVVVLIALLALGAAAAYFLKARAPNERRVIVIGLDGADWQLFDKYIANGSMPNLARLVREGRSGALKSFDPRLSPLVWTTMMTGVSPLDHRILDFTRFNPVNGQREPITSDERVEKAVWEMANDNGRDVAVFGLWATHPAEPVRGRMISDRLFAFLRREDAPPGVVHPKQEETRVLEARAQVEREVSLPALQAYFPWLTAAEYESLEAQGNPYAHPATALRRILIETRLYHRLAIEAVRRAPPALSIVYFQGTDSIGHVFAAYAPPRQPEVDPADFERYSQVAEAYFREIDGLLGEYQALAASNGASLLIVSDHGFLWGEGRPTRSDGLARATAELWHRDDGIYVAWGPGIDPVATRGEGKVAQVASTILALLRLPRAAGIERPALADIKESDESRNYGGRTRASAVNTEASSAEALERLRALGYMDANEPASRPGSAGSGTRTAGSFNNEGVLLQSAGKLPQARAAFEEALKVDPRFPSAQYNLAGVLEQEGQSDRADALLLGAVRDGLGNGARRLEDIVVGAYQRGQSERGLRLLNGGIALKPDDVRLRMIRGRVRIRARDCAGALEDFDAVRKIAPTLAVAHGMTGTALMCLGRPAEARRAFERSLELDPSQARLREMLAASR
jgi:tetratricopeptide (TPR) repeat protein